MKKEIRKGFVDEIRKALPQGTNAAIYLANQLGLGKETVYRRLRGTVPFTLDEAANVARKLGISLDHLVGITAPEDTDYKFSINYYKDFEEKYSNFVSEPLETLDKVAKDPAGLHIMAANFLPYSFYGGYEGLADFRFKRWLYERGLIGSFSNEEAHKLEKDYHESQSAILAAFRNIASTHMIWDENVFRSLVREVNYFRVLSMLSNEDVRKIRGELLHILDSLEELMASGVSGNGGKIYFYLSNVIFDTSYSYMESEEFQASYFHVYSVHYVESRSPEICEIQKAWLQTMLRHSTLITQSGEIERTAYLKEQRALVRTL